MKPIRVSPGRQGWRLRVNGSTIALFPSRKEAQDTARDMAERNPELYHGHCEDQVWFSMWVSIAAFAGLAAMGLAAFLIAIGQAYGWIRWPEGW